MSKTATVVCCDDAARETSLKGRVVDGAVVMRRVLMISPHFPPDTSAGTHRVRLLAPYLRRYGWEPTVVTVDPRDYEGRLDSRLSLLVPPDLRVIRCRAWSARGTRWFGVGDLGLRAFRGLRDLSFELLRNERFDATFITIYPTYPALLGPFLKRRFGVPFVLDYQDPWVGAWGKSVGGARDGRPDLKSRLSRTLAALLERRVVRFVDAITAVSSGTYEQLWTRYPRLRALPCATIPIGAEPADFESLRSHPIGNPYFDPHDGQIHLCYVGTILPLGFETLRAVLQAVALLRDRHYALYKRLRIHCLGTSNQITSGGPRRVLPVARDIGIEDCVQEVPPRIDYLESLTVQTQASAILMMGSSEAHYTPSKVYPGLLARRPILAIYHSDSSGVRTLRQIAGPPAVRLITYNDINRAESQVEAICVELAALISNPAYDASVVDLEAMKSHFADALAGKLAGVFDRLCAA